MENAVVTYQPSLPMISIEEVKNQVMAVETCIKTVMVRGRHFGEIPGCGNKPTLLKPGAEMLAKLFQIRPEFKRTRTDLGNGHFEILSSCTMYSHVTGKVVGEGAGICSTMESKYRWRKAQRSCPKCGIEGSIGRSKFPPKDNPKGEPGWYCKDCKAQFDYNEPMIRNQECGRTENSDIADQYNTVSKMADKRGYVAAVITTTGASDYVTQDIEDFSDNYNYDIGTPQKAIVTVDTEPEKSSNNKIEDPIKSGERIKKLLEERKKNIGWEEFKKDIINKYGGKLTDILSNYSEEIEKDINNGEYDLPF